MRSPRRFVSKEGEVSWRIRFRDTRGRQSTETFKSEREARAFASDLDNHGVEKALSLLMERLDLDERNYSDTLAEVFARFLEWKAPRVRSDRTIADYERAFKLYIEPRFGSTPIATITPLDVQAWIDEIVLGKYTAPRKDGSKHLPSPKTVRDMSALLSGVMKYAAAPSRGIIESNPCVGVELPKRRKSAPKGLMPAEWQALDAAMAQLDRDAHELTRFLVSTGWRWSEATALDVASVEDYGDKLYVTMGRVVRRDRDGRDQIVEDGKGEASLRRVRLDNDTAAMVRRRCCGKSPGALVFTTRGGSTWHYSNYRDRYWTKAVDLANLSRRPTPHWLRHTHVGWLILAGASLPELQARIGHASIQTTIGVYGRMIADVQEDSLARFTQLRDGSVKTVGVAVDARQAPLTIESEAV